MHPETAVVDQLDPAQESVAKHRAMGFAVANVMPAKGVFRGESAVMVLRAGAARELVVRDRFAEVVALETQSFMGRQYPSSRMGAVAAVRQAFLDAGRDEEWSKRYAANPQGMEAPEFRSSDAPLLEVLHGQRPVIFVAIAALDPGRFANLATEFNLKAMTMARGLGDRPEDLGLQGMPLLLPLELPEKVDTKDADALLDTTLRQMQASIAAPRLPKTLDGSRKLAFVTAGMKDPKQFTENLAAVVKAGLDPARALAALTTTPAELLGVSRVMGTLEPGKQANLMIVDGELFTDKPALRHLFVQGYHEKIDPEKPRRPEAARSARQADTTGRTARSGPKTSTRRRPREHALRQADFQRELKATRSRHQYSPRRNEVTVIIRETSPARPHRPSAAHRPEGRGRRRGPKAPHCRRPTSPPPWRCALAPRRRHEPRRRARRPPIRSRRRRRSRC